MLVKADKTVNGQIEKLFAGLEETMIQTYLEGHMGEAWVDDLENPTAAQITVSMFTFYAGDHTSPLAEEMLNNIKEDVLIITESEGWKQKLERIHVGAFEKYSRYRFEHSADYFDRNHLENLVAQLPEPYVVKRIDQDVVELPSLHQLSPDFTGNFESSEAFLDRGVGYVVLHEDKVVSGASSFSIFDEGIEIEVGTDPEYRRKGLATVVSAALMLDCLDHQLYPSWDAENIGSAKLAESLGYVMKEPYDTYYVFKR
ncbi:GNAT family N-acetyltransferase [Marinilactibacillus sp. Marseille-P9653]|uniref:GNAT family N-acetyltransferase n=1 Tax=Marinilactibacillus sp. Marseille-P9653 TaxID=2866583 RepID=UPI001CE40985|nr:GNAT family N-acetyltransferase [Marinilactibacillus sp. Marseille-P9653]